jgi:predicted transcriptional regulator
MITPKQIKIKRAELDITQRKLAEMAGVSVTYLNQIERGIEDTHLTSDVYAKIEQALENIENGISSADMKFGKLCAIKEMRQRIKDTADKLDDINIMKLYDFSCFLSVERK